MEEQSAFDILREYPLENGFYHETNESTRRFLFSPTDPILNTKYILFKKGHLIYLAYDSYAAKAFMSKTFTGIYRPIDLEKNAGCKIRKRNWVDSLFSKRKKTGIRFIDNNFTILCNSDTQLDWFNENTAVPLKKLQEKIHPLELLIQNNYLPIVEEFKGKRIIGLETNQWIYRKEEVEMLLNTGGEILEKILDKVSYTKS
jgi:hypothetical protein